MNGEKGIQSDGNIVVKIGRFPVVCVTLLFLPTPSPHYIFKYRSVCVWNETQYVPYSKSILLAAAEI